jgi:hypothetical protein
MEDRLPKWYHGTKLDPLEKIIRHTIGPKVTLIKAQAPTTLVLLLPQTINPEPQMPQMPTQTLI